MRKDHELPLAIDEWGWQYHHIGIPTEKPIPGERYLAQFKMYVEGFDISEFGVEWMRFEPDSPVSPLIQTIPHIAFKVKNLDEELTKRDFTVISYPNAPSNGVRVAMILHNGAPVELIEFIEE